VSDRELTINPSLKELADGDLVWLCSREQNPEAATEQECELTVRDIKGLIQKRDAKERNN
jgi:hypothetical protein